MVAYFAFIPIAFPSHPEVYPLEGSEDAQMMFRYTRDAEGRGKWMLHMHIEDYCANTLIMKNSAAHVLVFKTEFEQHVFHQVSRGKPRSNQYSS